ncbi:hypothetical protein ASG86_15580 [Arthrobacter sp. Soil764]|nr:hypothetical protein ASG86_15580 [Arthrobacter sp. Soil764]
MTARSGGSHSRPEPDSRNDGEVIEEALQLIREVDSTPLVHMTPLFYQHAYEELRMTTLDLLRILGHEAE